MTPVADLTISRGRDFLHASANHLDFGQLVDVVVSESALRSPYRGVTTATESDRAPFQTRTQPQSVRKRFRATESAHVSFRAVMLRNRFFFCIALLLFAASVFAQPSRPTSAAELQLSRNKLATAVTALYVAAHPDERNTAMLACLANERLVRTGLPLDHSWRRRAESHRQREGRASRSDPDPGAAAARQIDGPSSSSLAPRTSATRRIPRRPCRIWAGRIPSPMLSGSSGRFVPT